MTAVVPDSEALRAWLRELPAEEKKAIRAKRHPWIGPRRMLRLIGCTYAGDRVVLAAIESFGQCRWSGGRWNVDKAQLSLFPSTPAPARPRDRAS